MLTQQQIDFYHENGYIGVESVLSEQDIIDLRRVTDEFVEKSVKSLNILTFLILNPVIPQNLPAYVESKTRQANTLSMIRCELTPPLLTSLSNWLVPASALWAAN